MRTLWFGLAISLLLCAPVHAQSLRFYGHGGSPGENFVFPDRVKVDRAPPSTANIGAGDFTVEFFLRAQAADNPNGGFACGFNNVWVNSNIIIDADRFGAPRGWGIGLLDNAIVFGADDDFVSFTACGAIDVLDDNWHHVAVDRDASSGILRIWIDGALDVAGPMGGGGPTGSLVYLANFVPNNSCSPDGGSGGASCENSDPFLVFGAEKHGFAGINYSGLLDEVRLSSTLRYNAPFAPPTQPFVPDADTVALYHFDEAGGNVALDDTGGENGVLFFGGSPPAGPLRSADTPLPAPEPGIGASGAAALLALRVLSRRRARRRAIHGRIHPTVHGLESS